jgi:adenylylsulfate kinase-like enzyme
MVTRRTNLSKARLFKKIATPTSGELVTLVACFLGMGWELLRRNSPYREVRDEVRQSITSEGSQFIEVYVQCPIEILVERDVKGPTKALAGGLESSLECLIHTKALESEVIVKTDSE